MGALRIFNTLTRTVEEFQPVTPGRVLVYGCGLTANRWANVGNLRTYVVQDLMVRVLMTLGHEVVWVMKVSDIAHSEQVDRSAPVEDPRYEVALLADLDSLGVRRPDVLCRPVEHIAEMIRLVADLERIGITYTVDGNVYFSVGRLPEYGRLAGQQGIDAARSVARVERDQLVTRRRATVGSPQRGPACASSSGSR